VAHQQAIEVRPERAELGIDPVGVGVAGPLVAFEWGVGPRRGPMPAEQVERGEVRLL